VKNLLVLFLNSLKRVRILVLAMGALLAAFQALLILVAKSVQESNAFDEMEALIPPIFREMMGPSVPNFMSFGGIVCLGYFHLSVTGSLVGLSIVLSTMHTSEIETGYMDLILSRPLARHWIISRSILILLVCTVGLLAAMMAGTWAGLRTLAPADVEWPRSQLVLSLAINLGLLMVCWGGVAMAIGAICRRRSVAAALAGLAALATFLLDYVARAWKPAESVGWLSPFRYYSPFELLMGKPIPAKNLLVLAGVAITGFTLAYILFSRRDISH
jgi:ABC-2 type transport system permease protein